MLSVRCTRLEHMSEKTIALSERHDGVPTAADVDRWIAALGQPATAGDQAERIDRITALERLKSAAAAAQARETVAFKQTRLADEQAAGIPATRRGQAVRQEIALARRTSPHRAGTMVGLADALVHELPNTMAALTVGDITEWRAMLVTRETACLSREDRTEVDARLAGRLTGMSDKAVEAEAKRIAYELDPHSIVERAAKAEADRRVTSRPQPDLMVGVTGLLPMKQGVAVMASLVRDADAKRATGDSRSKAQIMADTFVERLTGQAVADQVPVEVHLVMTDGTLLSDDPTPAWLHGYGPVPAPAARTAVRDLDDETKVWVRRLFTDPATGLLTAIDRKRRLFTGVMRRAIVIRDEYCRTPWCGAPIRHLDHVVASEDGGETSEANGQGLCEACNYAKQAAGWETRAGPEGAGAGTTITTPTGHSYGSRPPPLLGAHEPPARRPPRMDVIRTHPFSMSYAGRHAA